MISLHNMSIKQQLLQKFILLTFLLGIFASLAQAAVFIDYGAAQQSVVQFNVSATATVGSAGWILPDTQLKFINGTVLFNVFSTYTNLTNASVHFNRSATFFYFNSTKALSGSGSNAPGNYTLQRFFNISVDTTTMTEGNYSANFTIVGVDDTYYNLTYYNSTTQTGNNTFFIVDNLAPTVAYLGGSLGMFADGSVADQGNLGWINVTVVPTELYPSAVTFVLANSTTLTTVSRIIGADTDRGNLSFNFTGLPNGNYTFNATINDSVAHMSGFVSRSVILDTITPVPTMTSGSGTTTTLSVEETMTCAQTDANPANVTMTRSDKSANQCTGKSSCTAKFKSDSYTSPTFTCKAYDQAGHTKSVTFTFDRIDPPVSGASSSTTSGGGSSSGSSSSTGINTVAAEQTTTAPINTPEVREVTFTLSQAASGAKVNVKTTSTKPAETSEISGKVYTYFDVTTTGFTSKDVKKSQVKFAVPTKWLKDNSFTTSDIALYVYRDGVWKALKTSTAGGDETSEFFTSETDGFSTFAVVAQKQTVAPTETKAETGTKEKTTTEEQAAAPSPVTSKSKNGWIVALLVLIVIVVAFVVMKKKR